MILEDIAAYKRLRLQEEKAETSLGKLLLQAEAQGPAADFGSHIRRKGRLSIIAEVKKASPSKGIICSSFDHRAVAEEYTRCGVEAVSVLTEDKFFLGSTRYLQDIRALTETPLLRKDFIIDEYQVVQSRALGADAILLIAALLSAKELGRLLDCVKAAGLQCIVEVHDREELERVLDTPAEIIGINNRDLRSFRTDIRTTEELRRYIPPDRLIISESGIRNRADMEYMESLEVDAVLVGESLMRSQSIRGKLKELRGDRLG